MRPSSNPNFPSTKVFPWFLDLGLRFPFSAFMKGILLCYDIAICNLSPAAFRFVTCFELLNQWFRAKLDIPEFRMLHNIWSGSDDHYYFRARASLLRRHTSRTSSVMTKISLGTYWLLMEHGKRILAEFGSD